MRRVTCRTLIQPSLLKPVKFNRNRLYLRMTTSAPIFPLKKLNDGKSIPLLGYGTGTALLKGDTTAPLDQDTITCITDALSVGYRHIDCAEYYNNEAEVGAALAKSSVPRSELFITTKAVSDLSKVSSILDKLLSAMGIAYVDMYLIHNPWAARSKEELQQAWRDMETLQAQGKTRSIGMSNCQVQHLETILEVAKTVPCVNQVELHPYLQRDALRKFCKEQGIALQAFSPLNPLRDGKGAPGPLDPVLVRLAGKYKVQREAVLLRWSMQMGVITLTTSKSKERMRGYFEALEFELEEGEVEEIKRIGKEKHFRGNHFMHRYEDDDQE